MRLPYIDDRRMVLYGKVTTFSLFENSVLLLKPSKLSHDLFFSTSFRFSLQAFGGYLTLKMLAATDKLFQCTAVVAPITDFRLYSELRPCQ